MIGQNAMLLDADIPSLLTIEDHPLLKPFIGEVRESKQPVGTSGTQVTNMN